MKSFKRFITEKKGFDQTADGKFIGYKVMKVSDDGTKLISGKDSRQSFDKRIGSTMTMPGQGVFLSNDIDHVLAYYSGLADFEALLTLEFDYADVVSGHSQFNDNEPEIGVRTVKIVGIKDLESDE